MTNMRRHPGTFPADDALARPLALARHLLDGVYAFSHQLSELGAIDLPPVLHPARDASQLQAVAPLYLAAELEAARLVPAVETLAGLLAGGALRLDSEAAALLYRFWQGRHNRFSRQERAAVFARLFGHPSDSRLAVAGSRNRDLEGLLSELATAILRLQPDPILGSRPASGAAVTVAASRLASNLASRSGGITAFAAREIVKTIEQALTILKLQPVQAAVGANSVWTAVYALARDYLNEDVNITAHVQRGRSGMLLLTWLAEVLPRLDSATSAGSLVPRQSPVYGAAVAWLQASQDLLQPALGWQAAQGQRFPRSGALQHATS